MGNLFFSAKAAFCNKILRANLALLFSSIALAFCMAVIQFGAIEVQAC